MPTVAKTFKKPHAPIANTTTTTEVASCHAGMEVVGSKPRTENAKRRKNSTTGPNGNETT